MIKDTLPQKEKDIIYNLLHDTYAPVAEALIVKLRGFYLKHAQLMGTVDFFVPRQYLEFCKRMQSEVPSAFPPGGARKAIEKSLGKKIEDIFDDFEDEPIGSASIGQVHRAKLKGTRKIVAVKVQVPGIERKFRSDLKTIKRFCWLAMPEHLPSLQEIENQFLTEFDYVGEAQNMNDVKANMEKSPFSHLVVVPASYPELTRKDVLTMDYIEGETLIKGIKRKLGAWANAQGLNLEKLEQEQVELLKNPSDTFQTRLPDTRSQATKIYLYNKAVHFRDSIVNGLKYAWNISTFNLMPLQYSETPTPPNIAQIINTLALVSGYQILVNGCFNADPHPGNFLLLKNSQDERIGLVDFGQTKRFGDDKWRIAYARIVLALAYDDQQEVVRVYRECGVKSTYNKQEIIFALAKFWNDSASAKVTKGMNVLEFLEYCQKEDPAGEIPQELVMPSRASVLIRGLTSAFGLRLELCRFWAPIASKVLKDAGVDYVPKKTSAGWYEKEL